MDRGTWWGPWGCKRAGQDLVTKQHPLLIEPVRMLFLNHICVKSSTKKLSVLLLFPLKSSAEFLAWYFGPLWSGPHLPLQLGIPSALH